MQLPYLLELTDALDPAYREVIDGIGSRVQGIRCLLAGELAAPSICREDPREVDLIVADPEDRNRLSRQLRGIFRPEPDGSVTFIDGGVELDLRPRFYTHKELGIQQHDFLAWYDSATPLEHLPGTFRVNRRPHLLSFFLLREIAEDDEHILYLLRAGTMLSDTCDLPASALARASTIYAGILNGIADDLEDLGNSL